jgi:dihydropteroate synthase
MTPSARGMNRACLAGLEVGDGRPVALVGAINLSPESFYAGSVAASRETLLATAEAMVGAGAALLDVGAMSTAPYRDGAIEPEREADRLGEAIQILVTKLAVPVSADTSRVAAARVALQAGARVINDVRGLTADPGLARLVAASGAGLIVMASERGGHEEGSPTATVLDLLAESLTLAAQAGIAAERIVVDPGLGFFRRRGMPWYEWDCAVLAALGELRALGRPVCVGASRKSFIGALDPGADDPVDRLPGSLAAGAAAVLGGAHLIRTHDVAATRQAVRVAEGIARAGASA